MADNRRENLARDKRCRWTLLGKMRVRTGPAHEDGNGKDQEKINIQELTKS